MDRKIDSPKLSCFGELHSRTQAFGFQVSCGLGVECFRACDFFVGICWMTCRGLAA